MFLVTGFPKSGTQYTAACLTKAGIPAGHERVTSQHLGMVSWKDLPKYKKYDHVAYIIRNPIHTINSAMTINGDSRRRLGMKNSSLSSLLDAYIRWVSRCREITPNRFLVEDLPETYKELYKVIGFEGHKEPWPLIGGGRNTRKNRPDYGKNTKEDLRIKFPDRMEKIEGLCPEYFE
jgi:hypothetical protein